MIKKAEYTNEIKCQIIGLFARVRFELSPDTRLVRAFISSSVAASCFSFSSSCKVAMDKRSAVMSSSVSSCLDLSSSSATSSSPF